MVIFRTALLSLLVLSLALEAAELEKARPNPKAIQELAAGKRNVALASWWGFNPTDSTAALQAAINSGAKKLIVENMGAPWIVDKLQLASDQQVVFRRGVVVQAWRGAFKGGGDSLFSASLKTNITLTGYGAVLRMWKQDYDDKAQYAHAEWRHVLNFHSCSGVRVTGLTLADSGGDGIYLGVAQRGVPCSDVLIKDVVCDNNYRQGISVISARNLLIENCVLKNTSGTAPMAGIDFEPNDESEELTHCVMRNCVSENNRGCAYAFYLPMLRGASKPLSIRLEHCRSSGCKTSVSLVTGPKDDAAAVKGTMEFINCKFENAEHEGISLSKPLNGAEVAFINCAVINAASNQPAMTPIVFTSAANGAQDLGGVRFVNCTVQDRLDRLPMSYQDISGCGLLDITGTLTVKRGNQRVTHRLDDQLISTWMPHRSFKQIARFDLQGARFEPVMPEAKPGASPKCNARQRGLCEFLLLADAGQEAAFTLLIRPVGKGSPRPTPVTIVSPSGKRTKLQDAAGGQETAYAFQADETGAHRIICEPGNSTATVNSASNRICLYSESASMHFISMTGQYFFWVPPGTREFAVKVNGDNSAERVKATLCDSSGNKIEEQDNISQACQLVAAPRNPAQGEIWSLCLDKPTTGVLEDYHVELQGVPPVLSCSREALLKPVK
jgi:hypothetical protein